jgi:hypothetical protein
MPRFPAIFGTGLQAESHLHASPWSGRFAKILILGANAVKKPGELRGADEQ